MPRGGIESKGQSALQSLEGEARQWSTAQALWSGTTSWNTCLVYHRSLHRSITSSGNAPCSTHISYHDDIAKHEY